MTLFIDQSGDSSAVFGDLYSISRQDGGLGDSNVAGDPTVIQVTYIETAGQPATADRLNTLVNTDFGTPIVLTALPGGIDPYSGLDVTGNGFTYIDSTSGADVIRIVYDDSQCVGSGIFMFDVDGNHISTPNPVILYHELSHAFRAATGTTQPNDEIPAETDENVMRSELGLCLRDVNNHDGGCGSGDSCGGTTNNGCFIVSAATGSRESAVVLRLKLQRDRIFRATDLGSRLMDAIYRDYYRFSPRIAAEMQKDPVIRDVVLSIAVRPLVAWYTLANVLALTPADDAAAVEAVAGVWAAVPSGIEAQEVAAALRSIQASEPLPADASLIFVYLAERIQQAPRMPFASWAILEPLVRVWTTYASGSDVLEAVQAWLVAAPLETLEPPAGQELEDELAFLASGPFAPLNARQQVGRRLLAAWPETQIALVRHGFVVVGGDQ